ncbi:MAG: hypothetical protein Kow002_17480 [Anaerolineales bacterium]
MLLAPKRRSEDYILAYIDPYPHAAADWREAFGGQRVTWYQGETLLSRAGADSPFTPLSAWAGLPAGRTAGVFWKEEINWGIAKDQSIVIRECWQVGRMRRLIITVHVLVDTGRAGIPIFVIIESMLRKPPVKCVALFPKFNLTKH